MVALFLFFCVCKSVSIYVILGTQKIKVIDMIYPKEYTLKENKHRCYKYI